MDDLRKMFVSQEAQRAVNGALSHVRTNERVALLNEIIRQATTIRRRETVPETFLMIASG
jgi:hypothetical protein